MSDQNEDRGGGGEAAAQSNGADQAQLRIERIFLKDASFESPSSPEVFLRQWRPELKLDINTQANRLGENQHQVVLTIVVICTAGGEMTKCEGSWRDRFSAGLLGQMFTLWPFWERWLFCQNITPHLSL